MNSIKTALAQGQSDLSASSDSARLDAELLLAEVIGQSRAYLYAHTEEQLSPRQWQRWQQLLQRRQTRYPMAYLLGSKEFWSLSMKLSVHTLIPRPATEAMVAHILDFYSSNAKLSICDLGTGSGAIAIALAKHRPLWDITAVDIQASALAMAAYNASLHHCKNITFIASTWLKKLCYRQFDLIVSNPPYLAADDPHLNQTEIRYEPKQALISANQGLNDLDVIIKQSFHHLKPNGKLLLEHGYDQQRAILSRLQAHGYIHLGQGMDQDQIPRFCFGFKPSH